MGLSSFWTAIKKPRFSDSTESRKHVDRVYDHHDTVSPVHVVGNEPPHHFDSIYDTHHHILPSQNNGPRRHPSSPPRIHSPPLKSKKHSLWKSASLKVKPTQTSDALKHENSTKRRSFWQHERKESSTAPAVQPAEQRPKRELSKRRSFWRSEPEHDQLLPANDTPTTDIKAKRSSRRLSLRRSVSSQSSKRNSLRFSFLANGAGDSDDEDIPAVPAIPANIQRQKSRAKDPGRHLSMGANGTVQPGTAITSDDVHGASAPKSSNSVKRHSLSKLITNRKSTSDMDTTDTSSNKRKRRSWFSVHGSESSPETAVPPMPTLYNASGAPVPPSEAAFHAFLHNAHKQAAKTQAASDYERFLRASRAYDASIPTPPHYSQRNSLEVHAPRPLSTAAPTALPQIKPRNPKRASHCRPKKADRESDSSGSPTSPSMLSNEQQREWAKLRQLMDNEGSQPSDSSENGLEDDEGVMGMLRQLSREEDEYEKTRARNERRLRDRQRYLGIGTFENKDALAALEAGPVRR